jgi:diadenosine tetraphosphatase ApaH/serine/threonine PP2A family protein phosphatase
VVNEEDAGIVFEDVLVPVSFLGHTHLQGSFASDGAERFFRPLYNSVAKHEVADLKLEAGTRYLINPGSVGQPRDGDWRSGFAMFDSATQIVSFHRLPYNLRQAQERIIGANLPQRLATRLAAGK